MLINVIEHVKNPVDICERAFELLRPGGCLVIRWPQFAYRGSLSAAPEHLHGFTGQSIATLFNKLGFINVRDYWAGIGDFKRKNNLIKIILAIIKRIQVFPDFGNDAKIISFELIVNIQPKVFLIFFNIILYVF